MLLNKNVRGFVSCWGYMVGQKYQKNQMFLNLSMIKITFVWNYWLYIFSQCVNDGFPYVERYSKNLNQTLFFVLEASLRF